PSSPSPSPNLGSKGYRSPSSPQLPRPPASRPSHPRPPDLALNPSVSLEPLLKKPFPGQICNNKREKDNRVMQSQLIVNPKPFLADLTGKQVRVRLKWGQEYQGKLASSDAYMNLQLTDTEEFIDGQFAGALGEVLIRCNNVLYMKAADSTVGAMQE
ncbi:hypothetical protein ACHAWF_016153, partial [Thalassiosira exigua]